MSNNSNSNINFERFGKLFFEFYMEKGFSARTKAEIDCKIYALLCEMGYIDDSKSSLTIARELKVNITKINQYKKNRFYNAKDEELKKHLIKALTDENAINNYTYENNKIVFCLYDVMDRYYLKELLSGNGQVYDSGFNSSLIKLTYKNFSYLLKQLGENQNSSEKIFQHILKNNNTHETEIKKIINSQKNFGEKIADILKFGNDMGLTGIISDLIQGLSL